jgi:predicted nucleotidyltransferase
MAQVNDEIISKVRETIGLLKNSNILIKKAYLFGSYASGSEHEWSDIDIALVSDDFSDDRFKERLRLMKIINSIDNRIEPVPYNPEQFTETDPLVWEIKKHGIEINPEYS